MKKEHIQRALDSIPDGVDVDELLTAHRERSEQRNRDAQKSLRAPAAMLDSDWVARKAWLLDGQPIYGELKVFYRAALDALQADDQAEYSRQRDLLFKALRTFLGEA